MYIYIYNLKKCSLKHNMVIHVTIVIKNQMILHHLLVILNRDLISFFQLFSLRAVNNRIDKSIERNAKMRAKDSPFEKIIPRNVIGPESTRRATTMILTSFIDLTIRLFIFCSSAVVHYSKKMTHSDLCLRSQDKFFYISVEQLSLPR